MATEIDRNFLLIKTKEDFVSPTRDGMWRSPVAQRSGGPEVASSNLVIPTDKKNNHLLIRWLFYFFPPPCQGGRGVIYNRCVSTYFIISPSSYMLWVCLITNE